MTFLIQQTMLYAVPLMIVALAGVFAERSGIINLALEGIMIFGAFIGVYFVRLMQGFPLFVNAARGGDWVTLQLLEILAMLVAAGMGALFSLLLSFASINLKADQTIGGTALNLMAPALVLFLIRVLANQNTLQMATGDSASWFMIKKSTFGIDKNTDLGFLGETFLNKVYLATYLCIIIFIILFFLHFSFFHFLTLFHLHLLNIFLSFNISLFNFFFIFFYINWSMSMNFIPICARYNWHSTYCEIFIYFIKCRSRSTSS